jgi:hypothetical protein
LRSERPELLTSGLAEVLERIDPVPLFHHFMQLADTLVRCEVGAVFTSWGDSDLEAACVDFTESLKMRKTV